MKFDTPATTNPIDQLKVIGKPTDRIEGKLKTCGQAPYAYEQHEAVAGVPVQNLRHAQAGLVHQALNLGKRRAVFLVGRRVHDDQAAAIAAVQAQIAAKARIGRSGAQGCGKQLVLLSQRCQPGVECGVAGRICPGNANCGGDRSGHG